MDGESEEAIRERWQKYMEDLKVNDPDEHAALVKDLEEMAKAASGPRAW